MAKIFRPTILSKGLILVVVPLLFELTFGFTMFYLQGYYHQVIAQETKAKAIIFHANEMWLNTTDACVERIENRIFGADNSQLEEEQNIQKEFDVLKDLVKNEPLRLRQLKKLRRVSLMLVSTGSEFEKADKPPSESEMEGGMTALRGKFSSFQNLQKQLRAFGRLIRVFREPDELRSRDSEKRVAQLQVTIERVIICAVVFSVMMNALLLLYFMKGINRGILAMLENTKRMARSEPLLPQLKNDDELGDLDKSFHLMAREVESARRRERATINNAGDMIVVLDEEFNPVSVNPAVTRSLGYSADEVRELGFAGLMSAGDYEKMLSALKELVEGRGSGHIDFRMKSQDGQIVWTSWTLQWSALDKEFFCVAHDISEMKRMEQMKQEFFGMISHDMRTPLTSIVSAVDCILAGIAGEVSSKAEQYLKLAEQSAHYLLNLVRDLLDVERLTAGAFPLNIEEFDFQEIFKHASDMVAPLALNAGLTVKIPEGEFFCKGDRDALTRVVVNLVSNAIKFSPKGSSIDIDCIRDREGIKVEISDHGRGIPEEQLASVFERFKQVSVDDRKKKGGTGLGLAICKGFVEAHGGSIGVKSKAGEGSTFWFHLPQS